MPQCILELVICYKKLDTLYTFYILMLKYIMKYIYIYFTDSVLLQYPPGNKLYCYDLSLIHHFFIRSMPNPEKSPVTKWWPVWVRARAASSKGAASSVLAWFWADSGTNLIKQGEIVTGRPCRSVVQWSECSHGLREVLGWSPGRAMCFYLLCDICKT